MHLHYDQLRISHRMYNTTLFSQRSCNSEADNHLARLLDGGLGSKRELEDGVTIEVVKV